MDKRNKSTLPGLIISKNSTSSLEGIKNDKGGRGSSALPIMKYLGNVKPSRNERIIKPDMTSGGKVTKQDLPIIREVLKPGFSGNFRTNYTPPSAFDADALAYFTAAGITDTTEKDLVNQLVLDLKGTGSTTNNTDVWSDMNAIYPVSPTSLSAAAYNLKDPTSYNITWQNSPTHSADGVVGNGSTQYGDTGFNINTNAALDSFGLTVYLNTYNALTSVEIGAYDTAFSQITGYAGGNTLSFLNQAGSGAVSTAGSAAVLTSVRTASNAIALYKNGVSVSTATTASTSKPNGDVYVLARNNIVGGAPANLSTKRMAFAAIHAGLTANQAKDLYDAITTYNTALSR